MSFLPKFSSADDFWPLAARPADPATALLGVLAASARRAGTGARATVAQIIVWRLHRRASQELSRLDGRMLRDMGLGTRRDRASCLLPKQCGGHTAANLGRDVPEVTPGFNTAWQQPVLNHISKGTRL